MLNSIPALPEARNGSKYKFLAIFEKFGILEKIEKFGRGRATRLFERYLYLYLGVPRGPRGNSEGGPRGPREILKGAPGAIN